MEPFEKDSLSDQELDAMMAAWKSPTAPARLRTAIFPVASAPWWRRIGSISFRVPLPVACAVAILFALEAWRSLTPPPTRIVIRTERVEVPVVKREVVTQTIYRDRIVERTVPQEWQPVAELRSRIIRRRNDQN